MATLIHTARWLSRLTPLLAERATGGVARWAIHREYEEWFTRARAMVALALGESPDHATRIARKSLEQNLRFHLDYERLARYSLAGARARIEQIDVPEAELVAGILRRHHAGVIYATAHTGNYLAALMRLAQLLRPKRRVAVIKREEANERETRAYRHFAAFGVDIEMLRVGARPAAVALRTLRRGDYLVVLYDVHEGFGIGHRTPVTLFDHPAALPLGPAALAARTGAMILPLAVLPDRQGRERLVFEQPILPHESPPAMVQRLAGNLERWIREAPECWMLWPHLAGLWVTQVPSDDPPGDPRSRCAGVRRP